MSDTERHAVANSEARKRADEHASANTRTDLYVTAHSQVTAHPGTDVPCIVIQTAAGAVRLMGTADDLERLRENWSHAWQQLKHPAPFTPDVSWGKRTGD